jgi:DNA-binding MarR family transcriptional regulator
MSLLSIENQLCFAIYSAEHAFMRVYKPLLDKLGLTYAQYLVMLVLWAEDGLTVSDIGARVMLESNTLTPLLKRLEAQGLITRARDKADERQVRVHLTAAGRKLAANAREVPKCIFKATGLSAEELLRLKQQIDALRGKLLAVATDDEA